MERLFDARMSNSFIPITPDYRPRLLLYYKWKHRLEPIYDRIKCIVALTFHVLLGAAAGTFIFHSLVCAFNKQDFRYFCGNRETDITVSICGGIFGFSGSYFLQKFQICQRCSCLSTNDPWNSL